MQLGLRNVDRSCIMRVKVKCKCNIETYGLDSVSICSIASDFTLYCQLYTFHLLSMSISSSFSEKRYCMIVSFTGPGISIRYASRSVGPTTTSA